MNAIPFSSVDSGFMWDSATLNTSSGGSALASFDTNHAKTCSFVYFFFWSLPERQFKSNQQLL